MVVWINARWRSRRHDLRARLILLCHLFGQTQEDKRFNETNRNNVNRFQDALSNQKTVSKQTVDWDDMKDA